MTQLEADSSFEVDAAHAVVHGLRQSVYRQVVVCPPEPSRQWDEFQQMVGERLSQSFDTWVTANGAVDALQLRSRASPQLSEQPDQVLAMSLVTSSEFEGAVTAALAVVDPVLSDRLNGFRIDNGLESTLIDLIGPEVVAAAFEPLASVPTSAALTTAAFEVAATVSTELGESDLAESWSTLKATIDQFSGEVVQAALLNQAKPIADLHGALQVPSTSFQLRVLGGDVAEMVPMVDAVMSFTSLSAAVGGAGAVIASERGGATLAARVGARAAATLGLMAEGAKALAADRSVVLLEIRDRNSPAAVFVDGYLIDMPFGRADNQSVRTTEFVDFDTAEPTTLGELIQSSVSLSDTVDSFDLVFSDVPGAEPGPYGIPIPVRVEVGSSGLGEGTYSLGGGVGELLAGGATATWSLDQPDLVDEAGRALAWATRDFVESLVEAGYELLDAAELIPGPVLEFSVEEALELEADVELEAGEAGDHEASDPLDHDHVEDVANDLDGGAVEADLGSEDDGSYSSPQDDPLGATAGRGDALDAIANDETDPADDPILLDEFEPGTEPDDHLEGDRLDELDPATDDVCRNESLHELDPEDGIDDPDPGLDQEADDNGQAVDESDLDEVDPEGEGSEEPQAWEADDTDVEDEAEVEDVFVEYLNVQGLSAMR